MNLTKKTSEFGVNLSVYSRKNSRINLLICFSDKINVKYLFLSTGHFSTILDLIFRQYIVGLANKYVWPLVDRTETFYSFHSIVQRLFSKEAFILSFFCICTSMCICICTFICICIFTNVWAVAVGAYWSLCRVLRSVIQRSRNYCHKWHRPDRCFSSHNLSTMLSSQTRFTDPSVKDVHFSSDNWKKLHLFFFGMN